MTDEEQIDRLNQLADRLFCPDVPTFVGNDHPPFDIKPVNLHESKKEFLEEFRTVSTIVDHLQGVIGLLELSPDATEPLRDARIRRVQIAVDGAFRQGFRTQKNARCIRK